MNALTLVFVSLCVFTIAYRFYGLFIANKVLELKSERATPAVSMADGHDYVKTNKYVLFGDHFAAIVPDEEILKFQRESNIDLIVIGTNSRKMAYNRRIFGSKADRVVKYSQCPVLTVMPASDEPPESKYPKLCSAGEIRF